MTIHYEIMSKAKTPKFDSIEELKTAYEATRSRAQRKKIELKALSLLSEMSETAQRVFAETDSFRQTALILGLSRRKVIFLIKSTQTDKEKLFLNFLSK